MSEQKEVVEDFLENDDVIRGQEYVCLSFISPENVIKDKNIHFVQKFLEELVKKNNINMEQKDIDNLLEILNNFILSDYVKIWLQPLSMSPKATQLCYDACLKYNFNLSLQTHKYANIR